MLSDSRFKSMFENPDFEINEESDEFQLIKPVLSKQHEKEKRKRRETNEDKVTVDIECLLNLSV